MSGRPVLSVPAAFELDEQRYALRKDWTPVLTVLPYQTWHVAFVFRMLRAGAAERLATRLYDQDDPLDLADVERVAGALVEAATGWPWYSAARLAGWAVGDWPLATGLLANRGVHLTKVVRSEPSLALNCVYALLVEHADERKRMQLDAELTAPPPGERPSGWTEDEEGALFLAALAKG